MDRFFEPQDTYMQNKALWRKDGLEYYTKFEEVVNISTHAIGGLLGLIGIIFLLILSDNVFDYVASAFGGVIMTIPFIVSTVYHSIRHPKAKKIARKIDHSCVGFVILGCGIPLALCLNAHIYNYVCIGIVFSIMLINLILTQIDVNKFTKLEVILDLIACVFFVACYFVNRSALSLESVICYAVGSVLSLLALVFFCIKKQFFHAIFHLLSLLGTVCYYTAFIFILL